MNINWTCTSFHELSPESLYEILRLRSEVFVVEQQCIYLDMDDKDQSSHHLMGRVEGKLLAYARLLPPGVSYPDASSIGRVVSSPSARNQGLGKILMGEAILRTSNLYPDVNIKIGAQLYLLDFYKSLGFDPIGEPYLEDGIPHIEMMRLKKSPFPQ